MKLAQKRRFSRACLSPEGARTRQGAIATWQPLPLLLSGVERAALRDANPVGPAPSRRERMGLAASWASRAVLWTAVRPAVMPMIKGGRCGSGQTASRDRRRVRQDAHVSDYDLTRLGSTEFQHLTQALALKVLGGEVGVFGAGRDGGRDMTFDGPVPAGNGTMWTGYTVAQVKHRHRPGAPDSNATWLRNEIRKELDAWTAEDPKRKGRRPENLLFVTNVILSAVPGSGIDHVLSIFNDYKDKLPLGNYDVWHYDHVCRLLDNAPGIRTTYSGLITPGDVLEQMHHVLAVEMGDLGEILRTHAAMELQAEQWVRLGEAGSRTNDKLPLGRVAIDLRATQDRVDDEPPVWVLRHVVEAGDQVHRRSVRQQEPHMVLVGGPGQGKTTLAQMLCQIYRLALLDDPWTFGEQVTAAVKTMRDHLESLGVPTPASKRWPLRVELSKYADQLAGNNELTLLRYVAERITHRSNRTMTPARLQTWLRQWPWLLVLDGFDEVASPPVRDTLVERVQDLLVDVAANDADMLIVATTRPGPRGTPASSPPTTTPI
jgi:hypothetical protein